MTQIQNTVQNSKMTKIFDKPDITTNVVMNTDEKIQCSKYVNIFKNICRIFCILNAKYK